MSAQQGDAVKDKLVVWLVHPDLGIGGAEMLVVNAAMALLKKGHDVRILTSHHDPERCFSETKPGGPLGDRISVKGAWLPRTIFGRFHVVCAVVRMCWIALAVTFLSLIMLGPDIIICDQVSHVIPFLRWGTGKRVLFYCHFPDKLLCVDRSTFLKRLYRRPVDWWEEVSTGTADSVVVNSRFTGEIFRSSFLNLGHVPLRVLYPSIEFGQFDRTLTAAELHEAEQKLPQGFTKHAAKYGENAVFLLSINRFERKKNLLLAIQALMTLLTLLPKGARDHVHLIMAGGYDPRLEENVTYINLLEKFVQDNGLSSHVSFLRSFSNDQRLLLISRARCVLYTPDKEHFGIVPIEAMYAGRPVIAVASGGPLESIKDGFSGFLIPPGKDCADGFAQAARKLVLDPGMAAAMGRQGREDVSKRFSLDAFGSQLDDYLREIYELGPSETLYARFARVFVFCFVVVCLFAPSYGYSNKMMLAWLWASIPVQWFRALSAALSSYIGYIG